MILEKNIYNMYKSEIRNNVFYFRADSTFIFWLRRSTALFLSAKWIESYKTMEKKNVIIQAVLISFNVK